MQACKNIKMRPCGKPLLSFTLLITLLSPSLSRAAGDFVVPEGTRITLQLNKHLSTKTNSEGDSFDAVVTEPVFQGDRIVIPKGSKVEGSITRIVRPGRFKGKAVMNILFQSINIPGRGQLPLVASLARVDTEGNASVHPEGSIDGEGSVGSDIGKVLVPGLAGAGIGTLAGGGKGAGIGAGVGAAIGLATVFATRGKDLEVRRGSTMDISLDRPLAIPQESESSAERAR
jgi:hypothetical protein